MKIKDLEAMKKWEDDNKDPYGAAIIGFAKRWAELMEEKMTKGIKLEECAKELSFKASEEFEGITGFMYGAGVAVLVSVWEYGEQLRIWHNLDTQISNEGEEANKKDSAVLNPALLNIGEK